MTDADGDTDTRRRINSGAGVFQIEDDGPNAVVTRMRRPTRWCWTRRVRWARGGRRQRSGRPCDGDGELCRQLLGGGGLWQRRSWQRVLCTGADRFERGSGLFALGVGGAQGASIVLNQAGAGCRHHRHGRSGRILPHQHRPGDGRGDVQPEHQRLARQHRQRRRHLDADAGERRRSAGGADGDRRRRRQRHGVDQPGRGRVPDRGRRSDGRHQPGGGAPRDARRVGRRAGCRIRAARRTTTTRRTTTSRPIRSRPASARRSAWLPA